MITHVCLPVDVDYFPSFWIFFIVRMYFEISQPFPSTQKKTLQKCWCTLNDVNVDSTKHLIPINVQCVQSKLIFQFCNNIQIFKMSSKEIKIFTVDSFSPVPFGGNPAAVCLLDEDVTDDFKQKIAEEMKLSETAFVVPVDKNLGFDKGSKFGLRWFTPTTEVPLCGHATLASAAVLFYSQGNENVSIFVQIFNLGFPIIHKLPKVNPKSIQFGITLGWFGNPLG